MRLHEKARIVYLTTNNTGKGNKMYEDDCYEADCREEDEARFEEAYGSDCLNCGQSIYSHDDKACAELGDSA